MGLGLEFRVYKWGVSLGECRPLGRSGVLRLLKRKGLGILGFRARPTRSYPSPERYEHNREARSAVTTFLQPVS